MLKTFPGFAIDEDRLKLVFQTVHAAARERYGIFHEGTQRFLPQWNLPPELEHAPQRTETKDPEGAARFLFTRCSVDRISLSAVVHQQCLKLWNGPYKWMFDAREVIKREAKELDTLLKEQLYYAVPINKDISAGMAYLANAQTIATQLDNDPRNLIRERTVEEARTTLKKLTGFGSGLANLYLLECGSRAIANPLDPHNFYPKIDRHKARIPMNTDVVTLRNGNKASGRIHASSLVEALEQSYRATATQAGLDLYEVDAVLWVIGSEGCAKNNLHVCQDRCPLYKSGLCQANTQLKHDDGYFYVHDGKGTRLDARKNQLQRELL